MMAAALAVILGLQIWLPASAQADESRFVRLGLNKSMVIRLPTASRDVLLGNPAIVDAVVRTQNTAYLFAKSVGQTNAFFFDADGRQILSLDIEVALDGKALQRLIERAIPGSRITVDTVNSNVILSGTAANAAEARRAVDLAAAFVNGSSGGGAPGAAPSAVGGGAGPGNVINNITIIGKEQVMLRVRVAELQRDVLKQFGIDTRALFSSGGLTVGFVNANPFTINGALTRADAGLGTSFVGKGVDIDALVQAYERDGLIRTLAEPTLTAISGENAKFLAGGEFPIPVQADNNSVTVEYKKFGVSLDFTPTVLQDGLISLDIAPEVSSVDPSSSYKIGTIAIPGFVVRRAHTSIDLKSGQSFMIAGLLQSQNDTTRQQIPGFGNVPVLGALFSSKAYQRKETDLVMIVTPYLVKPMDPTKKPRTPADGTFPASTSDYFLGNVEETKARGSGELAYASPKRSALPAPTSGHFLDLPAE